MGCHVGHPGRMTCRSGRGSCGRVADLPSRRVRLGRKGADPSDPHVATGEGSEAVDGIPRACVAGGLGLEQRQRPLRTVGGPHGQHSPVVLAQRQGTRRAFHTRDCPIAGSALAYWLGRYGFNPTVVEVAPALRGGGYAVDFRGPVHLTVLERMGVLEELRRLQTGVSPLRFVDESGVGGGCFHA